MNIARKCKQDAVYWANPVADGYGGHSYDTQQAIKVRWEDKQELYIDAFGKERISTSIVYYPSDFSLNGYMHLGTVADFDSSADLSNPEVLENCFAINKIDKSPNVKGTTFLVKAWL